MKLIKRRINSKGFGHIETLILLIVLGVLIITGVYVYHVSRPKELFYASKPPLVGALADLDVLSATPQQIQIQWEPSTTPGVSYQVVRDGSVVATTTATTYTDNNVSPDTTYDYSINVLLNGQVTYQTAQIEASSSTTCSNPSAIPHKTSNSIYPLIAATVFNQATDNGSLPSNFQNYGNDQGNQLGGGGFISGSNIDLTSNNLQLNGVYSGTTNPKVSPRGVIGAGFDLNNNVTTSGGFDVCFAVNKSNWQNVNLVLISWPTDRTWSEGEIDFAEGNPQGMDINIHPVGCSDTNPPPKGKVFCGDNVYRHAWPAGLVNGGVHVVGVRYDSHNGYRFYLDRTLFAQVPLSNTVKLPTGAHHLSIQLQDTSASSTSSGETATIYWAAAYSYDPS